MRLIVVSNRLPFTVSCPGGRLHFQSSSGGLTTGLWSYLDRAASDPGRNFDFLWLGWPGAAIDPEHIAEVREHAGRFRSAPVFFPPEAADRFYHGFCNRTLWPLFHYFPSLARYKGEDWADYQRANRVYAEAVVEILRPDDIVWVHDYQLMLVPGLIRKQFPDMPIGFFLHIPFPSYEVFRLLPRAWRMELVEGVLGASLVGFHTHDYARDFLTSVLRTAGYEHQLGSISLRDRVVKVDTFPMGIDFDRFAGAAASADVEPRVAELRGMCAGQKVIFSVDRLDYTKGLLDRLRGYELFLKTHPEWHGKVTFILSVAPSRTGVRSYQAMKQELEQLVGRIAGGYGNVRWTPLVYQFRNLAFDEIVAMYRLCDVALITPLRDGMNLVAKEFIASRPDQTGVLILSEMAGAAKEMGEALIINPFHSDDFARTLEQALSMPVEEQVRRNEILQERLRRYDVNRWGDEFIQAMFSSQSTEAARRAKVLTGKAYSALVQQYRSAGRRALLLDYDGTLVPYADTPKSAPPDPELIGLIASLARDPANELAIVSGRPRANLAEWFGALPIALIAEHGVCLKRKGGEWRVLKSTPVDWKERVRPILQLYVDRLPGALLEEKEFSLAWHFRRADPEQASQRAQELVDDLSGYTRNIDVQVLEGNKVIEIRNTGINKGSAATEWLGSNPPPFILGIGDDWTDEDLFRALPPNAFTVRVGVAKTTAQYHLASHASVRRLLAELASIGAEAAAAQA
ncbi:MAG: bifunctional alpha,alpha-trehalose-phosphate synthase (UDP-forming)/trehalose-phosphatase [Verrucomicrobiota bacterium]